MNDVVMSSSRTFYEVLNVTPNVSFDELRKSYKQLILKNHPDKLCDKHVIPSSKPETETESERNSEKNMPGNYSLVTSNNTKFVEINKAWNTLKDPVQRKLYDAELIAKRFQEQSNIFANVKISELAIDHNDEENDDGMTLMYTYNCRCGGQYVVDESVAQEALQNKNSEILVECSECSLTVLIHG